MPGTRRRPRSKHPGVKFKKRVLPSGAVSVRAVYNDPDTGLDVYVTLDPTALGSAEARREWAVRKSRSIAKRRMELEDGAPRATGKPLKDALDAYLSANTRLRPGTLGLYQQMIAKVLAWAKSERLVSVDDFTKPKLASLRHRIVVEPLRTRAAGGRRGEMRGTDKTRSPHTVNSELRRLGTILRYLHENDFLPKLSEQDLRRGLKRVPAPRERPDYLKSAAIRALLEAALQHDAEVFEATREEHAGRRSKGSTHKYEPIAPFIALLLLSGMRLSEGLDLTWGEVDFHALNDDGEKVGEIHLGGADNKTHRARTVDLEVSPALRDLLAAMHGHGRARRGSAFDLTEGVADAAAKRLKEHYRAPEGFTFQALRRTCGTFLTNAYGIFGAASAYRSAKQLGHSVQVAERNYVGLERGIPRSARTVEAAMQIEDLLTRITSDVSSRAPAPSNVVRLRSAM
jgi:integrase